MGVLLSSLTALEFNSFYSKCDSGIQVAMIVCMSACVHLHTHALLCARKHPCLITVQARIGRQILPLCFHSRVRPRG